MLLAVATVGWKVVAPGRSVTEPDREPAELAERGSAELAPPDSVPGPGPTPAAERDRPDASARRTERVEVASSNEFEWTGSIRVRDENGTWHADESGTFTWRIPGGRDGTEREVIVRGGSFRANLPDVVREVDVRDLVLEGRPAELTTAGVPLPVTPGEPARLEADWQHPFTLRVVSADTGVDLLDVNVLVHTGFGMSESRLPRSLDAVGSSRYSGSSPLKLPAWAHAEQRFVSLRVGSPGHAWESLLVDLEPGGERRLPLVAGGDLTVRLRGETPPPPFALRVRPADDEAPVQPLLDWGMEPADAPLEVDVTGLREGRYAVSVERGAWYEKPLVVGRAETTVRSGERGVVEIVLAPEVERTLAVLAGTLVVPAAWELDRFQLRVEADDADAAAGMTALQFESAELGAEPGEGGEFAWDAGSVPLGTYELFFSPLGVSRSVEVREGGVRGVRFEVPPPAEVVVETVDVATDSTGVLRSLRWAPAAGFRPNAVFHQVSAGPTGTLEFVAPVGRIRLYAWDQPKYFLREPEYEVHPGRNLLRVELGRPCKLSLRLVDGETTIPVEVGLSIEVSAVDHEGRQVMCTWGGLDVTYSMTAPGRYRVVLPELPGFVAVEPFEVELEAGATLVHDVELERTH